MASRLEQRITPRTGRKSKEEQLRDLEAQWGRGSVPSVPLSAPESVKARPKPISLVPGLNTGSPENPCPNCLTTCDRHEKFCRHYLYQRQWEREVTAEQCKVAARRNADEAMRIMRLRSGWAWMHTPEEAGHFARLAYRACLLFQLKGGQSGAA